MSAHLMRFRTWLTECKLLWSSVRTMSTRAATKMVRVEGVTGLPPDDVVFGVSAPMREVRQKALKICRTDVAGLLQGGGGTGEEVVGAGERRGGEEGRYPWVA